jgi:hypothetical protein
MAQSFPMGLSNGPFRRAAGLGAMFTANPEPRNRALRKIALERRAGAP